jgi:hypothetical protein
MFQNKDNSITIIVNYKENNYQFIAELKKPLNIFYKELCSYFQINPNNFNLLYNNKLILFSGNGNKQICSIINNNTNPLFKIVSKKNKTPMKLNLNPKVKSSNDFISITSRRKTPQKGNFLTISMKENQINFKNKKNKLYNNYSVIISQIPSVQDIENILNNYNNKHSINSYNNKKKNFGNNNGIMTFLRDDSVQIDFKDEIKLNEFISYISFIKYENKYFKNIIIQKDNSLIKKNGKNLSYSMKNISKNEIHKINRYNNSRSTDKIMFSENNININDVIKAIKKHELNNDCYHGLSLNRDGEDEIITDYYRQQNYLRNSSPYISENEKRILEEKENRKHFFKNKNFVVSVGKYSMKPNFIPNYVGMTPSENPKTHEFRKVNKNKWITNKGFNV